MNGRKDRVEAIFQAAMELNSPEEREAYLLRECGEDAELRREVEELLRAAVQAEEVFETRAPPSALEQAGSRIGHYHLLQKIGEGGCGVVYMAEQETPVRRKVALKIVKLGMDTRQVIARFEAERQALALMDHPNIAKVLDAGATETGRPYFVMELVRGHKITKYCDEQRLSTRQRLDLFIQVCQAVQHAHQKGIIHRDLKPSNILVTERDGVSVPKVIDFGIAKATCDLQLTDKTLFTAFEQFIGTPAYMSPEQARLGELDIDTRSDIYSLGVLLYELLTGKTPFEIQALVASGLDQMRRTIQELEPLRPSTRLREASQQELIATAQSRATDPVNLVNSVRDDLDWIVMRCLEKDRRRRYETANGLAMDVQRHIDLEPVQARPPSRFYQFQKLVRRNQTVFIASGVVIALIILVVGGVLYAWNRVQAKDQAHLNVTLGNKLVGEGDFLGALPFFWEALKLEQDVPKDEKSNRLRIGSLLQQCPRITKLWDDEGLDLMSADLSRDGRYLMIGNRDGTTILCDLTNGRKFPPWAKEKEALEGVSFSPDGKYAATAGEIIFGGPGFVKVWDMSTHSLVSTASPPAAVYCVRFTPDGTHFVTASGNDTKGYVHIYDTKKPGQGIELTIGAHAFRWVEFDTDGTRLVTTCEDGVAQVWDFTNRVPIGEPIIHPSWVFCAAFSPDGHRLVTGSADGTVKVCGTESGRPILLLPHPEGSTVKSAGFSPDGRYIVTACWDSTVRIWDASKGRLVYPTLRQNGKFPVYVSFTPDAHRVVTANANGIISLWDLATPMKHSQAEGYTCASKDGQRLGTIQGTNIAVFAPISIASPSGFPADAVRVVLLNRDGSRLITLSETLPPRNGTTIARLWNTETLRPVSRPFATHSSPANAFLSDDGQRLVTWNGKKATVRDPLAGHVLYTLNHAEEVTKPGGFSPNGSWLATISKKDVYVWNTDNTNSYDIVRCTDRVEHIAFSPDNRFLVICVGSPGTLSEREARIWDLTTRRQVGTPLRHHDGVMYAEFSHDGTLLVTASEDGTACVWKAPSGGLLFTLSHESTVAEAHFSFDDRWIVTMCEGHVNGTIRVWDAQTGEPLTLPLKHPWRLKGGHAQFLDQDRKILTSTPTEDGWKSMLWELPIENGSIRELGELAQVLSGYQLFVKRIPLTPEELQRAWEELLKHPLQDFVVSEQDIINWYLGEAEASEKAKQWSAAVFHWGHLTAAKPDNQTYCNRLNLARLAAGPGSEFSLESDYLPGPILNREIRSVRLTGKAPAAADGEGDIWLDTRPAELNAFGDVVKRMGREPGSIHIELRYRSTGPSKLTDRFSLEGPSPASAGSRLYDVVFEDSALNDHLKLVLGRDNLGPHRLLVFRGMAGKHGQHGEQPTHILPLKGEPRITSVLPDLPLSNPIFLSGDYTATNGARHILEVRGTLGGEGTVGFNPNFITVDAFGEATAFTLIGYFPQPVSLDPVNVPDPLGRGRKLYRAVSKSSPNTNRVSLVLGPTEIGPHQFLVYEGEQVVYIMRAQLPERRAQEVAASSYADVSSGEQQAIADLQRTVGYDFRCTVEGGQAVELIFSGFARALPPEGVLARLPHLRSITIYSGRFPGPCLADLEHLEQLHSLGFSSVEFEPPGLEMLGNIQQLEQLSFYRCGGIDDEGLKHLAKMTRLKGLMLYREELPRQPPQTGRRITDAGFAHLKGLVKLEYLDLLGHDLSDASVEILTAMTGLQDLGLSGKGFTDAGLNGLARLPKLLKLQLLGTGVTTNGIAAFKTRRPETHVEAGSLEGP